MARYDFYFTRLMYESGDWDVDIRMPSNVLNSLVEYTTLRVDPAERVIALSDPKMLEAPFCYLAGHKLVQFTPAERKNFERYVRGGGFVFVDDCNHDIDGLFAKSFEAEMAKIFGASALRKIPNNHPVYSSFFKFDGPPNTSVELNGWGDDLVHEYLRAIELAAGSACCTRTRTTAASGITTSATSAGWRSTTPALRSTSFNMRWEHEVAEHGAVAWTRTKSPTWWRR
jgi:hypothetical protein